MSIRPAFTSVLAATALTAGMALVGEGAAHAAASSIWTADPGTGTVSFYGLEDVVLSSEVHLVTKPDCDDEVLTYKVNIAQATAAGASNTKYKLKAKGKDTEAIRDLCGGATSVTLYVPAKVTAKGADALYVDLCVEVTLDPITGAALSATASYKPFV